MKRVRLTPAKIVRQICSKLFRIDSKDDGEKNLVETQGNSEKSSTPSNLSEICKDCQQLSNSSKRNAFIFLTVAFAFTILYLFAIKFNVFRDLVIEDVQEVSDSQTNRQIIEFRDVASDNFDNYDAVTTIAVGDSGAIVFSSDNGENWTVADTQSLEDFNSIALSQSGTAIAVGRYGTIEVASDFDWEDWDSPVSYTESDFNDVAFSPDGESAIAVGDSGIIRYSHDRGKLWNEPSVGFIPHRINDVEFHNGIAVAAMDDGVAATSVDNGETWQIFQDNRSDPDDLTAIAFIGDEIWVLGDNGTRWWTTSSCIINKRECPENNKLDNVWKFDDTDDRGDDFYAVAYGSGSNCAVAVGKGGRTWIKSESEWVRVNPNSSGRGLSLYSVAVNENCGEAIAVGADGTVIASKEVNSQNKSIVWYNRVSRTKSEFSSVALVQDGKTAFAVGESHSIFQFTSRQNDFFNEVTRHSDFLEDLEEKVYKKLSPDSEESETPKGKPEDDNLVTLLYVNFIRAAVLTIVIFLSTHFFRFARYYLNLSEFYTSRQLGIELAGKEDGTTPLDINRLAQAMDSLKAPSEAEGRGAASANGLRQIINWMSGERFDNGRSKPKKGDQSPDD